MKLIRKFAVQGHAIPKSTHTPRGPFPPEVLAGPQMEQDLEHADSLHVALDDVRFFKCKDCERILEELELEEHQCDEWDD
jgi:hypothetical protein